MKEFKIFPAGVELKKELQQKIDSKTKPVGALGRLEDVAMKIGLVQQTLMPKLTNPVIAVFAGDHGIADKEEVSNYSQEVTSQMVRNFLTGGAAINVLCRTHGITPKVIDAGVSKDLSDLNKLIDRKVGNGTSNYMIKPAMGQEQCQEAIHAGAELVDQWHHEGSNILGFGEMGIGNTSSASIITSLMTNTPLEKCTGKGTGLNEDEVAEKTRILQQALLKHKIDPDPITVLQTFGGFELAMIFGGILQATENRMTILIDGFIVTAALLLAYKVHPNVLDYVIFAHKSEEPGHQIQLQFLNANPLLNLDMRLGEGSGAAIAYPIVKSAVNFLNDMASFEDADVTEGS